MEITQARIASIFIKTQTITTDKVRQVLKDIKSWNAGVPQRIEIMRLDRAQSDELDRNEYTNFRDVFRKTINAGVPGSVMIIFYNPTRLGVITRMKRLMHSLMTNVYDKNLDDITIEFLSQACVMQDNYGITDGVHPISYYSSAVRSFGATLVGPGKDVAIVGSHIYHAAAYIKKGIVPIVYESTDEKVPDLLKKEVKMTEGKVYINAYEMKDLQREKIKVHQDKKGEFYVITSELPPEDVAKVSGIINHYKQERNGSLKLLYAMTAFFVQARMDNARTIIIVGASPMAYLSDEAVEGIRQYFEKVYFFDPKGGRPFITQKLFEYDQVEKYVSGTTYIFDDASFGEHTNLVEEKLKLLCQSNVSEKSKVVISLKYSHLNNKGKIFPTNNMKLLFQRYTRNEVRMQFEMANLKLTVSPQFYQDFKVNKERFNALNVKDQNRILSLQMIPEAKRTHYVGQKHAMVDAIYSLDNLKAEEREELAEKMRRKYGTLMLYTVPKRETHFSKEYGDEIDEGYEPTKCTLVSPQTIMSRTTLPNINLKHSIEPMNTHVYMNRQFEEMFDHAEGSFTTVAKMIYYNEVLRGEFGLHYTRLNKAVTLFAQNGMDVSLAEDKKGLTFLRDTTVNNMKIKAGTVFDLSGHMIGIEVMKITHQVDFGAKVWSTRNRSWGTLDVARKNRYMRQLRAFESVYGDDGPFHSRLDIMMTAKYLLLTYPFQYGLERNKKNLDLYLNDDVEPVMTEDRNDVHVEALVQELNLNSTMF